MPNLVPNYDQDITLYRYLLLYHYKDLKSQTQFQKLSLYCMYRLLPVHIRIESMKHYEGYDTHNSNHK